MAVVVIVFEGRGWEVVVGACAAFFESFEDGLTVALAGRRGFRVVLAGGEGFERGVTGIQHWEGLGRFAWVGETAEGY